MSKCRLSVLVHGIPDSDKLGDVYNAISDNCWDYDVIDEDWIDSDTVRINMTVTFEEPVYFDGVPSFTKKTPGDIEAAIDAISNGCDVIEQDEF